MLDHGPHRLGRQLLGLRRRCLPLPLAPAVGAGADSVGDELAGEVVAVYVHHAPLPVHPALAADVPVGHAVAVPLEAHEAVEGDLPARAQVPLDLGRDLERPGVRRARRLVLAHRDACRRAPPAASLLGAPEGGLPVEGVKVGKGPSREEVPLHEADEPLHLALRIGVARPAQPGAEADDAHELGVVGLPDGPAVGIAADDHALHVVGEHGRGHAQRREHVQHPDEEVLLARVREELDVGAPAMVADHGEAGDPRPLPARALDRDEAPVHLVGLSGRRPEALAAAALRGRLPPLRGHEVPVRGDIGLHRGEAAGVALAEQPLEYHLRVGDALPQEVVHQAGVAGEHARRGPPPAVPVGQGPEPVCPDRPRAGAGEPRPPAELREVACLRVEPVALLRGHLPERRVYNLL